MQDANPRVEAVAVTAGRIVALGTLAEIEPLRGPATVQVDLAGRTLLPGFFDPHGHLTMGGIQALSANVLAPPDGNVIDIPSLLQTVQDRAASNADLVAKSRLIIGFGYDPTQPAEPRGPTKEELETISTELPVLIVHQSGHLGAVNARAPEIAGHTAETPNPRGGVIQRVPCSTEPPGILEETAFIGIVPKLLGNIGADGFLPLAEAGQGCGPLSAIPPRKWGVPTRRSTACCAGAPPRQSTDGPTAAPC